jgi:hypothetical protein
MPAFVADFQPKIDYVLFAHLNVVGDPFAPGGFAPAAFVQSVLRLNQVAFILEQPLDAVVGAAAFFVGRKRHDDVAVRFEAFAFITNEVGDPYGGLRLIVAGAAPIEVAVPLDKLKRIHAPVFAFGFHHVGVCQQQNGFEPAAALVADHQIPLGRNGSAHENGGCGEAGGSQAGGHGFRYRGGRAGRIARFDLDQFFVDVTG